jgi:hypothetical protein
MSVDPRPYRGAPPFSRSAADTVGVPSARGHQGRLIAITAGTVVVLSAVLMFIAALRGNVDFVGLL